MSILTGLVDDRDSGHQASTPVPMSTIRITPAPPVTVSSTKTPTPVPMVGGSKFTEPRAYICRLGAKTVSVFDASSGTPIGEISVSHNPLGVAVSRDGNYVFISEGSYIDIVDARTNLVINTITGGLPTTGYMVMSPDDSRLYIAGDRGLEIVVIKGDNVHISNVIYGITAMGIGISPDGQYVITTDWGNCQLQVVNVGQYKLEKRIDLIPEGYSHGTTSWQGMDIQSAGQAVGLSVSPDGKQAAVAIWAGSFIPVVNLQSLTLEKSTRLDGKSYQDVAYSKDGSRVYVSHYDGNRIIVLDGTNYMPVSSFNVAASPMNIEMTPDGRYLYVTHEDGPVEVVDISAGKVVRTLDIRASKTGTSIAFNPAAQ